MSTSKIAALVLIVVGGILLYFGYTASESALESITETVTGRFTDQTTMYIVGGAACAVVGVGLLLFGRTNSYILSRNSFCLLVLSMNEYRVGSP